MNESNVNQMQDSEYVTIDLLDLARNIWNNIWVVLVFVVAGAVVAFVVTALFITPKYRATSTIYILSRTTSITSIADLQIGDRMAADFEIIATTRELLNKVIEENGLDMTYGELRGEISVENPESSHMLRITVQDKDPERAALLSNSLADELREEIAEIMNTDKPSAVEQAVVPEGPSSPNRNRNTVIGAVVGLVIALAILIIRYLTDDTIQSDDDVRKYLGLDTLAQFPKVKGRAKA